MRTVRRFVRLSPGVPVSSASSNCGTPGATTDDKFITTDRDLSVTLFAASVAVATNSTSAVVAIWVQSLEVSV